MTFLCDTNIISELARPKPNSGVLSWNAKVSSINLSVITVEEIYFGLAAKPNQRIEQYFFTPLSPLFPLSPLSPHPLIPPSLFSPAPSPSKFYAPHPKKRRNLPVYSRF